LQGRGLRVGKARYWRGLNRDREALKLVLKRIQGKACEKRIKKGI